MGKMSKDSQRIKLETRHIQQNFKLLKRAINLEGIIDHLVQNDILNTDENYELLSQSPENQCDFILRKLIRCPQVFSTFVKCLDEKFKDIEAFSCFRSLPYETVPVTRVLQNEVQGKLDTLLLSITITHINMSFVS